MLTKLWLENFKSWKDTGEIPLKPITGFFGPNSSGKSSLFQALLLMKQTSDSRDRGIVFHFGDEKTLVDLGDFESVIYKHDTKRTLKLSLGWNPKDAFEILDKYGGGTVVEGDEVVLQVGVRDESSGSGESLVLEEMAYQVSNGRRFGMRLLSDRLEYDVSARGPGFDFSQVVRSPEQHRLSQFHEFPFWVPRDSQDRQFSFNLEYGLEMALRDLYYLGPLRSHPYRIYPWSGAQPLDMGPAGEFAVEAILSSLQRGVGVWDGQDSNIALDEYVAGWLKRLGLIYDFRLATLTEGRRLFEVKVRKSPGSAEVLLTDVGFGVSQILPVLVLCFYVPTFSTLVLEQPEIHLHPAAQSGLADVFIDAWRKHDIQVLFESHSEHLLRRLQRRIAEGDIGPEDVGLFFCSMEDDGSSGLSQLEVDQFGNIANWPKDFFGDQFGEIAAMSDAAWARQGAAE